MVTFYVYWNGIFMFHQKEKIMTLFNKLLGKKPKDLDKSSVLYGLASLKDHNMDFKQVSFIGIYEAVISQMDEVKVKSLFGYTLRAMTDTELTDSSWYEKFCKYANLMGQREPNAYLTFSATLHADHGFILKRVIEDILN